MAKYHKWRYFRTGRVSQVLLKTKEDIEFLSQLDRKRWVAMSCPTKGIRFDLRMLELMDSDHDGRIRMDEVLGAIDFLKSKKVDLSELFNTNPEMLASLDEVVARQKALDSEEPSEKEKEALLEWELAGKNESVLVLGEQTAIAERSLSAVESIIDEYFAPQGDVNLVTEEAIKKLPLEDHINSRFIEAIMTFREKCVTPILGDVKSIGMLEWNAIKSKFIAFRIWKNSKPGVHLEAKAELDNQERVLRYKISLLEFLENFVNMKRLYSLKDSAVFQCGTLRIDARELDLCFHVDVEAAHAALAAKSNCCVLYLKLTRPSENLERHICAVLTAGYIGTLYVGRNGVFYDETGRDWEAVVTKIVEAPVSLVEAFWSPWKKLFEGFSAAIKKFMGDKQSKAVIGVQSGAQNVQTGGAAMASSVAAIGIGIGMVGTAAAAIVSAVSGLKPWWMIFVALAAIVAAVSLPSVILAWFKLRRRDIGAILNASGWAINKPLHIPMSKAKGFTKCL